jgi:hypothetical protein
MSVEVIDAPAGTSPATETATEEIAQGAPEVTPASPGDHAETTPPAKTELEEFKDVVAKAAGVEPTKPEPEAEAEEPAAKVEDEPVAEEATEDKGSDALSQEKTGVVPEKLTDRPEWRKLTEIGDKLGPAAGKEVRATLRSMFKTQHDLTQQVEKAKPAVEVVQEMFQSVGGSEQGFTNMRHLIKSYDADPAAAVPMLEMLLTDARKRAGLVIHSPELLTEAQKLDQQVQDGMMEQADADRRKQELLELQQARTVSERTKQQQQAERDRQQRAQGQQKQQSAINEIKTAADAWRKETVAKDPDYLALESLHTSRTMLLAEQKVQELGRMLTGKEARAVADQALKEVKAEVGKLLPKKTAKVAINGDGGSSGETRRQPGNEFEEFKATVAKAVERH